MKKFFTIFANYLFLAELYVVRYVVRLFAIFAPYCSLAIWLVCEENSAIIIATTTVFLQGDLCTRFVLKIVIFDKYLDLSPKH